MLSNPEREMDEDREIANVRENNEEIENIRKFQTEVTELKNTINNPKNNRFQQQTGLSKRTVQQAGRQSNGTHPDRVAKRKRN